LTVGAEHFPLRSSTYRPHAPAARAGEYQSLPFTPVEKVRRSARISRPRVLFADVDVTVIDGEVFEEAQGPPVWI
jgi:hypothetical protein